MAFPTGWGRRVPVVIQASKVDANLTDFTFPVTTDNLPHDVDEIFDADGANPARADGGDIRCSSDQAGSVQLAREVVEFTRDNNPANGTAQIWVKVGSISSATDTTIYVWYNAPSETEPAADSAFGSENAWDANYKAVLHLEEAVNNDADGYKDSTQYANHFTGTSMAIAAPSGQIGTGAEFDGTADWLERSDMLGISDYPFTFTAWVRVTAFADQNIISFVASGSANHLHALAFRDPLQNDLIAWTQISGVASAGVYSTSAWNFCVAQFAADASRKALLDDGAFVENTLSLDFLPSLDRARIGANRINGNDERYLDGIIDEVRISDIARSEEWCHAEYESANDPNAFAPDGAPEDPPGGVTVKPAWYYQRNAMRRAA